MKKNIVLIETMESMGTGILYPCKYEKTIKYCKSYLVFTNRHVLQDIQAEDKNTDYKKHILLQIFDDFGKKIPSEKIKRILMYSSNQLLEKKDDVAALLVDIDENISITLATKIYADDMEEESTVYMEGYPGVMLEDEVSQKIQLKGKVKRIFPENRNLGVYQITDDYHWYNDYNDMKLLEGFSGSPVYIFQNGESYLVGLNQSVANIYNGENPFKLVYYLKMKRVLSVLRNRGCIIFRKQEDDSYQIEWIYGLNEVINQYENKPVIMLLGGSGAGKSSFAIDFALHRDNLCVSNDGQTTRTSIIYEYKINNEKNMVQVQFFNKEQFCEQMNYLYGVMPMLHFFRGIFGLSDHPNRKDTGIYLQNCYYLIECICLHAKSYLKWFRKMEDYIFVNNKYKGDARLLKDDIWDVYENVLDLICTNIPILQVRYICDLPKIEEVCKEFCKKIQYQKTFYSGRKIDERDLLEQIIEKVFDNSSSNEQKIDSNILDILLHHIQIVSKKNEEFNVKEYQTKCCHHFMFQKHMKETSDVETKEQYTKENFTIIQNIISTTEFQNSVFDTIQHIEGFFSIEEFDFMFSFNKEIENEIEKLVLLDEDNNFVRFGKGKSLDLEEVINRYCKKLYDNLIQCMQKYFENRLIEKDGEYSLNFDFDQLSNKEEKWLTWCLQVKEGKSLTGIIKSVKISDDVSDDYALMFKELKISSLKILDTYGLDHVEWENGAENSLYDIKYRYQEIEKINLDEIGILYLKKLDSGRPEELKNILPVVCRVMPQAPVYSVFTGIDIFYGENIVESMHGIKWNKENCEECPKAVQYLLSDKGKEEIFSEIQCSQEKKANYYHVLKNNIVPFCGNRSLVEKQYAYYRNNLKHIRQLLSSIIMKEYSSIEIVDIQGFCSVIDKDEGRKIITSMLEQVFEEASIRTWNFHHKTVKANFDRIVTNAESDYFRLGFSRTYRHQWNQLFHEAYARVMVKENRQFLDLFKVGKGSIEAALINCEDAYLGTTENLHNGNLSNSEKNEFRKLLEMMYQNERGMEIYQNANPFKDKMEDIQKLYEKAKEDINIEVIRQYLNNVADFAKGFRQNEIVREKFVDLFIEILKQKIEKENMLKATNLVGLNLDFANALNELEYIFEEKYGNPDDESINRFYDIMRYHFTKKQKI